MKGKSPMMKALVGNQKNLNEGLKAAIKAAPGKMMAKTPSVMERMKTAMKVRGMGEDAVGKVRGMGEKSPNKIMKAKAAAKVMKEKAVAKVAKPDFPDIDGDGNTSESMKKAAADKKSAMKMKKEASKYGKRHDRLRARAKKLDDKSMSPDKPVSDKKFDKLQDRREKLVGKARKIRQKSAEKESPALKITKTVVAKKEGEKGKKIEYKQSTREWNSPKDLQNATSMVMAKINKAMPTPSAKKKELTAQAKKLLSTGAVGNLDKLMDRNKISGNFTSFKGFSITPKKKK